MFYRAGVPPPQACAYPSAGRVRGPRRQNSRQGKAVVPRGGSVSQTAPAAYVHPFPADPRRHLKAAELLDSTAPRTDEPARQLPAVLSRLMRDIDFPNGIGAVGFNEADIPTLVEGTLKQQRLLTISPRPVDADDLETIFRGSLANW